MKTVKNLAALTVLALVTITSEAQVTPKSTNDGQAAAIDLLRRTIAEQQANPGKIIRTEDNPSVTRTVPLSSEDAASRDALERQYLDGKLSARQYQKALDRWEQERQKRLAAEAAKPKAIESAVATPTTTATPKAAVAKPEASRAVSPKNSGTAIVTPPAGTVSPAAAPTDPTPQQKKISDVEARIDEMLRLKADREKAALTNTTAVNTNLPAKPLTRRQRLDAILKQNLDGKLSDADYQAQRAKILAEPE